MERAGRSKPLSNPRMGCGPSTREQWLIAERAVLAERLAVRDREAEGRRGPTAAPRQAWADGDRVAGEVRALEVQVTALRRELDHKDAEATRQALEHRFDAKVAGLLQLLLACPVATVSGALALLSAAGMAPRGLWQRPALGRGATGPEAQRGLRLGARSRSVDETARRAGDGE